MSAGDRPTGIIASRGRRGVRGEIVALVLLLVGAAIAALYLLEYRPTAHENRDLAVQLAKARAEAKTAQDARAETEQEFQALKAEREKLKVEHKGLVTKIKKSVTEIDRLQKAQKTLLADLEVEIRRGDINVGTSGGQLRVQMANKVLFPPGGTTISPRGKAVLRRVAGSLREMKGQVIQVAGHTDTTSIAEEHQEQFPTNWELSTARATNVVRFFQEACDIPGERLMASGFSSYRPVASNDRPLGRRQNRRIELMLVMASPSRQGEEECAPGGPCARW